jgi:hemolysin activation/secretion protein
VIESKREQGKAMSRTEVLARRLCLLAVLGLWAVSTVALAQTAPTPQQIDQIRQQQEQLQRDEQQRREQLLRQQDPARRLPGSVDVPAQPTLPDAPEGGPCFTVQRVELQGAERLSAAEQMRITNPFVGQCVGLKEIGELMREITNRYVDLGLVTSRVYIPQQDMSQGLLQLMVLEGRVGEISLSDEQAGVYLNTAFPGLKGKVLNIRDIEQGLDQINRLRSNSATMELQPSEQPGQTNIQIRNQPGSRLSGGLTLDNYGSPSTGDFRGTLSLSVDNPMGVNDSWFGSYSRNLDADSNSRLSESHMLGANFALGYWNWGFNLSKSRYVSTVSSLTQRFLSEGNTETYNLNLQHVLSRGQTSKLTLNTGITHTDSKNYIEGSLLSTGSPKATEAMLGLTSVFTAGMGSWTLDGSMTRGLKAFGVEALPDAGTGTVPTPFGIRYNASASYFQPLALEGTQATWSSSLQMQTSPHYLNGSAQMSIGGLFTVRGYDGTSLSAERGLYWRNDLAFMLPASQGPVIESFGRMQAYVALDIGRIFGREGQTTGSLAGMVAGVRAMGGPIGFDLGLGFPVYQSDSIKARGAIEGYAVYAKANLSF